MSNVMYTTTHRAVVPFYVYAGLAFLVATVLLFSGAGEFSGHYFQPHILAITHTMALGWGDHDHIRCRTPVNTGTDRRGTV